MGIPARGFDPGTATIGSSKRPAPGTFQPAPPPALVSVRVVVETPNPDNASGWTWQRRAALAKKQREAVACVLFGLTPPAAPWVVTLTRVSAGTLADDGLRSALKWTRDSCAVHLLGGKPGEMDDSPLIEWRYAQARGKRGDPAVDILIEPRGNP
jgi:hypothetical protein